MKKNIIKLQPVLNEENNKTEFQVYIFTPGFDKDNFHQDILSVYRDYKFKKLGSKVDLFLSKGFRNRFYNFLSSNIPKTLGLRWFIKTIFNLHNRLIRIPIKLNSYGYMLYDLSLNDNEELISLYTQYYTDENPLEYVNLFFVIKKTK